MQQRERVNGSQGMIGHNHHASFRGDVGAIKMTNPVGLLQVFQRGLDEIEITRVSQSLQGQVDPLFADDATQQVDHWA